MAVEERQLGPGGVLALVETQRENDRLRRTLAAIAIVVDAQVDELQAVLGEITDVRPTGATHRIAAVARQLVAAASEARRA